MLSLFCKYEKNLFDKSLYLNKFKKKFFFEYFCNSITIGYKMSKN